MFYLKWTSSELATLRAGALYTEVDEDGWVQRELGIGDDGLITHQLVPTNARPGWFGLARLSFAMLDSNVTQGRVRVAVACRGHALRRAVSRRRFASRAPRRSVESLGRSAFGPKNQRVTGGCHGFTALFRDAYARRLLVCSAALVGIAVIALQAGRADKLQGPAAARADRSFHGREHDRRRRRDGASSPARRLTRARQLRGPERARRRSRACIKAP